MNSNNFYLQLYDRIVSADIFTPDFPDETTETTLKALWETVAGNPCSARQAKAASLSEISAGQKKSLEKLVEKRLCGTPLAYLTGRSHFMGLEISTATGVLIPRPETELLASTVLEMLPPPENVSKPLFGIDAGCGSGNLSCAVAFHHPGVQLFAVDIADECVALSEKNITSLRLNDRVTIYKGDLFSPLADLHLEEKIDFIVSNPPYIPSSKLHSDLARLTKFEPEVAFNGGVYGFSLHHRLIKESLVYLKPGGMLFFEFGVGQEKQVQALFARVKGYTTPLSFKKDAQGSPRVITAIKTA